MSRDLNQTFNKIFKSNKTKKVTHQRKSGTSFGSNPRSDWGKLILTFTLINLLVIIWSVYFFWQIENGNIFTSPPSQSLGSEAATREKLSEILNTYDAREKNFEDLRQAKPVTVDPGI